MNKYKWLIVSLPINLSELSNRINNFKFNGTSEQGFLLTKASENELIGKFIIKKNVTKEVFRPFGEPEEISIVEYSVTEFSFYVIPLKKIILLELKNQPRTVKPFINHLNRIIGLGFTLKEFDLDLIQCVSEIEKVFGKAIVDKMNVDGVNIDNKAIASIQINSENDIRDTLTNKIFRDQEFTIKSIRVSFIEPDYHGGKLQLLSNSMIILNHLPERTFIRKFIPILLESGLLPRDEART